MAELSVKLAVGCISLATTACPSVPLASSHYQGTDSLGWMVKIMICYSVALL